MRTEIHSELMAQLQPTHSQRIRASTVGPTVAFLIFVLAIHQFQPDVLAPVTLIPPWLCLVPVLFSVALAWRAITRQMLIVIAALTLAFTFSFVEEASSLVRGMFAVPGEADDATDEQKAIRVITLNCNMGSSKAASEPKALSPDIVFLQESPGPNEIKRIAQQYFGNQAGWAYGGDTSVIANGSVKPVHADPESHFVHAVVTVRSGQQMDVVSLRLAAPVFRFDFYSSGFWADHLAVRIEHRNQLQAIIDHLKETAATDNWIIGGDFNLVGNDGALSPFADVHDSFLESGIGWGNTGTNEYPLFRVDQIWSVGNVQCRSNNAIATKHSDHRMVVADFVPK